MNSKKTILILGGKGLVGSQFVDYLRKENVEFLAPSQEEFNVLNWEVLQQYIESKKPTILINLIAQTNLEEMEWERDDKTGLAWQLNVEFPKKLADICQEMDIFLIHISTDAVFAGSEKFKGPFSEDQIPDIYCRDLSWYGETKRQGEMAIKNTGGRFAIVRIDYPFGNPELERDFARKTYSYIKAGYPLFTDQLFNPTYLPDLSVALHKIIEIEMEGIFHIATKGITTPFGFGKLLAELKGLDVEIKPGSARDFIETPGKPARPIFGGLDTESTEQRLGLKFHTLKEALTEFSKKIP